MGHIFVQITDIAVMRDDIDKNKDDNRYGIDDRKLE
jgi:hypothetical protein